MGSVNMAVAHFGSVNGFEWRPGPRLSIKGKSGKLWSEARAPREKL